MSDDRNDIPPGGFASVNDTEPAAETEAAEQAAAPVVAVSGARNWLTCDFCTHREVAPPDVASRSCPRCHGGHMNPGPA